MGLLIHCLILGCTLTCDHRSDIKGNHFAFQHSGLLWSWRCRDFPPRGLMPCFWVFQNNFLSCQFLIFIQSLWDLFHTKFSHVKFVAKICLAVSLPICSSCAVSIMPNSSQFSHKSSSSPHFQPFSLFSSVVSFKCVLLVGHPFLHLT